MESLAKVSRTPYSMMKTLILSGQYDKADMLSKMNKYLSYNKITQDEYNELLILMEANEVIG